MPMRHFFDPTIYGIELIYTVVIVLFCFLVYYKTREIYSLTKYQGIRYFRNAFLFFGLAYALRFMLHLSLLTGIFLDVFINRRLMTPIVMLPVGYFSTMAIFYLTYSTIWKNIRYMHFVILSNLMAILVSFIAFISRSPMILSTVQLVLLLFALIIGLKNHKKKKASHMRAVYFLITLFWLFNLFVLEPRRFLPFELKLILQIISVVVFVAIYYKVKKLVE